MDQHLPAVSLLDEVRQHFFRDREIGNDAIFHGPDSHDIARRTTKHILGFFADSFDLVCDFVDGNDRRLVDHDAATFSIDQGVRCTEVNRQIAGE